MPLVSSPVASVTLPWTIKTGSDLLTFAFCRAFQRRQPDTFHLSSQTALAHQSINCLHLSHIRICTTPILLPQQSARVTPPMSLKKQVNCHQGCKKEPLPASDIPAVLLHEKTFQHANVTFYKRGKQTTAK